MQRLSLAQFAYNNLWHLATWTKPACFLMGYLPRGPSDVPLPSTIIVPAARDRVAVLSEDREAAWKLLHSTQASFKKHYNHRHQHWEYVEGQWVWLSLCHIRQQHPSCKLADKYLGPFKIEKVVGDYKLAYQLALPACIRIYNVFPISSLEEYQGPADPE